MISKEETLGNTAVDVKVTCAVLDNNADGYSVTTHTLKKSDDTLVIKVSGPEGSAPNLTARTEYKTPVPRVSPPDALK